jgi:hypothetical protein
MRVLSAVIARDLRQQPIELIDGPFPEGLVTFNPSTSLLKRLLTQPKPMDAPFYRAFNEPGSFQHFEMLRNSGLRGAELAAELTRAASLTPRKRVNHRTPRAVGQGAEGAIEVRDALHSHMTICC